MRPPKNTQSTRWPVVSLGAQSGYVESSNPTDALRDLYAAKTPVVRALMISSLNGRGTGDSGLSGGLSCELDVAVFDAVRRLSDVIVVGAQTVRAEGYPPQPDGVPLAVVTRSGKLDAVVGDDPTTLVVTTPGSPAAEGFSPERVIAAENNGTIDYPAVVRELRRRGFANITCEGGPTVLADLLAARCIEELCLTTRLVTSGIGTDVIDRTGMPLTQYSTRHVIVAADALATRLLVHDGEPA